MPAPPANPTWFEWITVAAIVLGPIFALWAQRILDKIREEQEQQKRVFFTLMSTRATPLSAEHINALNSIPVVYGGQHGRKIREAWQSLLTQFNSDAEAAGWQERVNDIKADLLREIADLVGFNQFTTDSLKREMYYPKYYHDIEVDNMKIRRALVHILSDDGLKITFAATGPEKNK